VRIAKSFGPIAAMLHCLAIVIAILLLDALKEAYR
jgi:hypothetical protein